MRIILAADPGTANLGYAVLAGSLSAKMPTVVTCGVLKSAPIDGDLRKRLDLLGAEVVGLVTEWQPGFFVMEDFVDQGKYVGSTYRDMIALTEHLRVVVGMHVPVTIYPNKHWKLHTLKCVGVNKQQVQHYVSHKLPEAERVLRGKPSHIFDSVCIGLCKWYELQRAGVK